MWKSTVGGQELTFRLVGINNQNFLMRDEETGSWWQQVSGEAVLGPLAGTRLELLSTDEVSFAIWKQEHPHGLVMAWDETVEQNYLSEDWVERVADAPTVTPVGENEPLEPRDLIVGIDLDGAARAYPMAELLERSPVLDTFGRRDLVLVVADDGKSVRCFDRAVDGRILELFADVESESLTLVDAETGSRWDFSGTAVDGPLAGTQLRRISTLKDFWFDWQLYHPETTVFAAGL